MTTVSDSPAWYTGSAATTDVEHGPDGAVLWLRGEHDASTSAALRTTLAQVRTGAVGQVTVDLSEVRFMSATTLGVILEMRGMLGAEDRALVFRAPSPAALRILSSCGLSQLSGAGPARTSR